MRWESIGPKMMMMKPLISYHRLCSGRFLESFVFFVLGGGCLAMTRPCYAQGWGPVRVEVTDAVEREVAPTIRLVGTVLPQRRAVVASEVEGLVADLVADEGVFVRTGDLLCKLRDTPRRFAHAEAESRLKELKQSLAVLAAEFKKAEFEKTRVVRLQESHHISDKELNDALADFEAAQRRIQQAKFAIAAQKAVVERLADALARTEILAPFCGFVSAKRTEVGEWVEEGGDIVELLDLSVVRVRVDVPESYIGFCEVGAEASVGVDALGQQFAGRISRVVPSADERARTFPVEIDLPNPDGRLKAGMFVRASVPSGPKARRLLVPKDAVVMRGPLPMVFVVTGVENGHMAAMVPVEVLSEVYDYVAVSAEALSGGSLVVVRGNENMRGPGPVIVAKRWRQTVIGADGTGVAAGPSGSSAGRATLEADPGRRPSEGPTSQPTRDG